MKSAAVAAFGVASASAGAVGASRVRKAAGTRVKAGAAACGAETANVSASLREASNKLPAWAAQKRVVLFPPSFNGTKEEALAMGEADADKLRNNDFYGRYLDEGRAARMAEKSRQGCGKWRMHILGSAAGMEPCGCKHTSWILEKPSGELVWFDAGEFASWTAALMNLDITRSKRIFISHPHIDHIGGLAGLFASLRKYHWLYRREKRKMPFHFEVFTPYIPAVEGAAKMIWRDNPWKKQLSIKRVNKGEVFRDGDIAVDAIENRHMKPAADGTCQSYSYRIRLLKGAGKVKTIVFSGDIKNEDDLAPFFKDGCIDLLMIETGHHLPETLCKKISSKYPGAVDELMFVHHGVAILTNPLFEKARSDAAWGKSVIFADDAQTIELS